MYFGPSCTQIYLGKINYSLNVCVCVCVCVCILMCLRDSDGPDAVLVPNLILAYMSTLVL